MRPDPGICMPTCPGRPFDRSYNRLTRHRNLDILVPSGGHARAFRSDVPLPDRCMLPAESNFLELRRLIKRTLLEMFAERCEFEATDKMIEYLEKKKWAPPSVSCREIEGPGDAKVIS
jgi:hypothetical protein